MPFICVYMRTACNFNVLQPEKQTEYLNNKEWQWAWCWLHQYDMKNGKLPSAYCRETFFLLHIRQRMDAKEICCAPVAAVYDDDNDGVNGNEKNSISHYSCNSNKSTLPFTGLWTKMIYTSASRVSFSCFRFYPSPRVCFSFSSSFSEYFEKDLQLILKDSLVFK